MRRGKQAVLLLAGSVAAAVWMAAAPVESGIHVETAVVQPGELIQSVRMNGTVQYIDEQPYISLKAGKISGVYVQPGDTVREGDLLFQMDIASETQDLAELYQNRYQNIQAIAGLNEAASALSRQAELEWQQLETQLKAAIEAGQIRAAQNGVVDTVYVKVGDWVNNGNVLGVSRGSEKQVVATIRSADAKLMTVGSKALVETGGQTLPAVVSQIQPSFENEFSVIGIAPENTALDSFTVGKTVQIEVITAAKYSDALMPLAAAAEDGSVWVVAEGKVEKKKFEWTLCGRTHAQAAKEWAGERVVLYPERHQLKESMSVQVQE